MREKMAKRSKTWGLLFFLWTGTLLPVQAQSQKKYHVTVINHECSRHLDRPSVPQVLQLIGHNLLPSWFSHPSPRPECQNNQREEGNPPGSSGEMILYLSGQLNTLKQQKNTAKKLARYFRKDAYVVANETHGLVNDCMTTVFTKLGGYHGAVDSIVNILNGRYGPIPKTIFAHSQGAAYLALALDQIPENKRGTLVVHTFGGAGTNWPSGPEYHHFVNHTDIIPLICGKLKSRPDDGLLIHSHWMRVGAHAFETYFKTWKRDFNRKMICKKEEGKRPKEGPNTEREDERRIKKSQFKKSRMQTKHRQAEIQKRNMRYVYQNLPHTTRKHRQTPKRNPSHRK